LPSGLRRLTGNVKIFDIGNGITASDFTTRIRIAFNADPLLADIRVVFGDTLYANVADVSGLLQGAGPGLWRFDEPNFIYVSYKNDTAGGGVGQSKIQIVQNTDWY